MFNYYTKYYDIIKSESPQKHFVHNGTIHQRWRVCVHDSFFQQPKPRDIAVRFLISLWLLLNTRLSSWLHISSVTCLQFCSDLAVCSLLFNRVRLLNLALTFLKTDSPLLDWKLFTNTFCTSSLTLTNKFNETFYSHVTGMFINKLVKKNEQSE